jgi:hypothetical protein
MVVRHLRRSEQVINSRIPKVYEVNMELVSNIQQHFQYLHGLLQSREQQLMEELANFCHQDVKPLEDMKQEIANSITHLEATIWKAHLHLGDSPPTEKNGHALLYALDQCIDMPCVALPSAQLNHHE